ncbi:hypothetical protein FYK55_10270 [Roseiconus nitratireducens]|uniref:Tetratricopeptide repeat protein n=1 Tax=Roseiconus nitratireducens TaxID=2605748 RepID=A0A5M6DBY9_9BACT|nr:hypothetical protein [Roseiconus nitratireducens]KAA5543589.1 hypothetical protein FYK55_10270 [Roseiconus nitratireducens]
MALICFRQPPPVKMFEFGTLEIAIFSVAGLVVVATAYRSHRVNRLNQLAHRSVHLWESGRIEAALAGFAQLGTDAGRIRNDAVRKAFQFTSGQACGSILRFQGRFDDAERRLGDAFALIDQDFRPVPQSEIAARLEKILCRAASGDSEAPRQAMEQLVAFVRKTDPAQQPAALRQVFQTLGGACHTPALAQTGRQLLQQLTEFVGPADETAQPAGKIFGGAESTLGTRPPTAGSTNAYSPPPTSDRNEPDTDSRDRQWLWVESLLADALIAIQIGDYVSVKQTFDRLYGSSVWWSLPPEKMREGNRLMAYHEESCGSLRRSVETHRSLLLAAEASPHNDGSLANEQLGYASALRSYGSYSEALEQMQSAHENAVRFTGDPGRVSATFHQLLALLQMETGNYHDAVSLLSQARQTAALQYHPRQTAFGLLLESIHHRELGLLDEACELTWSALSHLVDAFGEAHVMTAEYRLNLAGLYLRQQRLEDAAAEIRIAENAIRGSYRRNAYARSTLDEVSAAYQIATGSTEPAEFQLRQLRQDLVPEVSAEHLSLAAIDHLWGSADRVRGDLPSAIRHLKSAWSQRLKTQPEDCPELLRLCEDLRDCHAEAGEHTVADRFNLQVQRIEAMRDACRHTLLASKKSVDRSSG